VYEHKGNYLLRECNTEAREGKLRKLDNLSGRLKNLFHGVCVQNIKELMLFHSSDAYYEFE
jgi:hypothetical protein